MTVVQAVLVLAAYDRGQRPLAQRTKNSYPWVWLGWCLAPDLGHILPDGGASHV